MIACLQNKMKYFIIICIGYWYLPQICVGCIPATLTLFDLQFVDLARKEGCSPEFYFELHFRKQYSRTSLVRTLEGPYPNCQGV